MDSIESELPAPAHALIVAYTMLVGMGTSKIVEGLPKLVSYVW